MDPVTHIQTCIEKAEKCESNLSDEVLQIIGMCGEGNRHLYNNVVKGEGVRCLEIGTYKGASTAAILCNNAVTLYSVDFMKDDDIKSAFLDATTKFKGNNTFQFLNQDCFQVDLTPLPSFNVYIYDGEHYEPDHYNALVYYISKMDSTFTYLVDDWNWDFVREGTFRAIKELKLKILYKNEMFSDLNESATPLKHGGCDARHWGNGCGVFVFQKEEL